MFKIEYHRYGTLMQSFTVPEEDGKPSRGLIKLSMDGRLRQALDRDQWGKHPLMCDVLIKNLISAKGKSLGTLFATKTNEPDNS